MWPRNWSRGKVSSRWQLAEVGSTVDDLVEDVAARINGRGKRSGGSVTLIAMVAKGTDRIAVDAGIDFGAVLDPVPATRRAVAEAVAKMLDDLAQHVRESTGLVKVKRSRRKAVA